MDDQTYQIIGAAFEVHRELGCGFLESVYQEALELELNGRKIPFRAQAEMPVFYKGRKLTSSFRADVLCYDSVIVELKALGKLGDVETAQILNYLKAGSAKGVSSSTSEQEACNMSDSSGRMNHGRRYDPKKEICVICVICGF